MKTLWETIAVAFAMFSRLPVPQPVWNEKNMRFALCAFPLVGVVCGLSWWGWMLLARALPMPSLLRAAGFCLLPVCVTGGIHLDGYADTCDALASYGDRQKKQEILRDPHCGAFAVIRLCGYFVLWFALCGALRPTEGAILSMGLGFVFSRVLSALAVASFPLAKDTGLVHTFASQADKGRVRIFLRGAAVLLSFGLVWIGRLLGGGRLAAAWLVFGRYRRVSEREFGGISGDLAGWFLQKAELWMLAALVACQLGEAML